MGCQYEIADKLVRKGADYVISLKGNQSALLDSVKEYMDMIDFNKSASAAGIDFNSTSTYGKKHGRKETSVLSETDCVIIAVDLGCGLKRQSLAKLVVRRGFGAKKCAQRRGKDVARCFGQNSRDYAVSGDV